MAHTSIAPKRTLVGDAVDHCFSGAALPGTLPSLVQASAEAAGAVAYRKSRPTSSSSHKDCP